MDEERSLDETDLPVDVSELGELLSAEIDCPDVYHLTVKPEANYIQASDSDDAVIAKSFDTDGLYQSNDAKYQREKSCDIHRHKHKIPYTAGTP